MKRESFSRCVIDFLSTPLSGRQIQNSGADFILADTPERIPISVPRANKSVRCFVSSITSALASYASTRIHDIESKYMSLITLIVSGSASFILNAIRADEAVILYNLPFSSVLFPSLTGGEFKTSVQSACKRYPGSIALRGLNDFQHGELLAELKSLRFLTIPYRRIFVVKDPSKAASSSRLVRRELRLMQRFPDLSLRVEHDFPSSDIPIAVSMYRKRYIEKYSSENADYSEEFLRAAFSTRMLTPITLRDEDHRLIGFVALYENESTVTAPLIGSESSRTDVPTYRILMIELLRYAGDRGKLLNWSSGVAEFKTLRGATSVVEYIAVCPKASLHRMIYILFSVALAKLLFRSDVNALLRT